MEATQLKETKKVTQKVQLVKGEFTPSEASHIIMNLIDEKINFHKIQRLQIWESNHNCKTDQIDSRIAELEQEKEIARDYINKSRGTGQNLNINGTLEISIAK